MVARQSKLPILQLFFLGHIPYGMGQGYKLNKLKCSSLYRLRWTYIIGCGESLLKRRTAGCFLTPDIYFAYLLMARCSLGSPGFVWLRINTSLSVPSFSALILRGVELTKGIYLPDLYAFKNDYLSQQGCKKSTG